MTTFVWSIDDAGAGGANLIESLQRMTAFFDERQVKSTWFSIPKPGGKPLTAEWKAALLAARDAGHDLQLHGLTHADCYEFGPPAWPATAIVPTLQPNFNERSAELLPRYTREKLRDRISEGVEIFVNELGVKPNSFRAPCGAICKVVFELLREFDIHYDSSVFVSGSGYEHLPHQSGKLTVNWSDEFPRQPFQWYSGVVEAPILNEYTWRGSGRRSAEFVELAKADIDRISPLTPIVVLLMHTHGIADDYEHTFRLVDAVIEHVRQNPENRFATFGELAASGAFTAAATVAGPDTLLM